MPMSRLRHCLTAALLITLTATLSRAWDTAPESRAWQCRFKVIHQDLGIMSFALLSAYSILASTLPKS